MKKIGCIIMASGLSTRFGSNKLVVMFQGKTLIQRIIDTTAEIHFDKRIVLTRSEEAAGICRSQGVEVIQHTLPNRNDAIKLGIEKMQDMDAVVFCPCDQPLLKRESIEKLIESWKEDKYAILRLAHADTLGTPILFSKIHFDELCNLPEKKGGGHLARKYPEKVKLVLVEDECELWDVDTPEDFERMRGENYERENI